MMYYDLEPFLLASTPHPDFNDQDVEQDLIEVDFCNNAIEQFCLGLKPLSEVLDILESIGNLTAEEYADQVVSNVEYCLGQQYKRSEEGLLVPYG